ncbi:MAG: methyltransferase domain-containing protein, partial [Ramlibacter sp.]
MAIDQFAGMLAGLFESDFSVQGNFAVLRGSSTDPNQQQTNEAFSEKWEKYEASDEKERLYEFQRTWYLKLYGFDSEDALAAFLRDKHVILDAGCGLGYKAEWFARLAPHALVLGMDFSDAAAQAARNYAGVPNLYFIQC